MSVHRGLHPPGWPEPRGYANGMVADLSAGSRLLFVGGQTGWNAAGEFERDDFAGHASQALRNVVAVLAAGGAGPDHGVRMTGM